MVNMFLFSGDVLVTFYLIKYVATLETFTQFLFYLGRYSEVRNPQLI